MNTTKLMVKLFLIISLFCATAFADDGNMSGGGFADDGNMSGGGLTADDGDMGTGSLTNNQILTFVRGYLFSIFE